MIKENTARCPHCTENLGNPRGVVYEEKKAFTLYLCDCSGKWLRPHNEY